MKKTLAFFMLLLVVNQTVATNWIDVTGNNNSIYYVDPASITEITLKDYSGFNPNNTFISVFVKKTYLKNNELRTKKGIYSSREHWFISCSNKRFILNGYVNYNSKDYVLNSWQSSKTVYQANDWNVTYPETLAEGVIIAVCDAAYPTQQYNSQTYYPSNTLDTNASVAASHINAAVAAGVAASQEADNAYTLEDLISQVSTKKE